jgi:hypothetical protein
MPTMHQPTLLTALYFLDCVSVGILIPFLSLYYVERFQLPAAVRE